MTNIKGRSLHHQSSYFSRAKVPIEPNEECADHPGPFRRLLAFFGGGGSPARQRPPPPVAEGGPRSSRSASSFLMAWRSNRPDRVLLEPRHEPAGALPAPPYSLATTLAAAARKDSDITSVAASSEPDAPPPPLARDAEGAESGRLRRAMVRQMQKEHHREGEAATVGHAARHTLEYEPLSQLQRRGPTLPVLPLAMQLQGGAAHLQGAAQGGAQQQQATHLEKQGAAQGGAQQQQATHLEKLAALQAQQAQLHAQQQQRAVARLSYVPYALPQHLPHPTLLAQPAFLPAPFPQPPPQQHPYPPPHPDERQQQYQQYQQQEQQYQQYQPYQQQEQQQPQQPQQRQEPDVELPPPSPHPLTREALAQHTAALAASKAFAATLPVSSPPPPPPRPPPPPPPAAEDEAAGAAAAPAGAEQPPREALAPAAVPTPWEWRSDRDVSWHSGGAMRGGVSMVAAAGAGPPRPEDHASDSFRGGYAPSAVASGYGYGDGGGGGGGGGAGPARPQCALPPLLSSPSGRLPPLRGDRSVRYASDHHSAAASPVAVGGLAAALGSRRGSESVTEPLLPVPEAGPAQGAPAGGARRRSHHLRTSHTGGLREPGAGPGPGAGAGEGGEPGGAGSPDRGLLYGSPLQRARTEAGSLGGGGPASAGPELGGRTSRREFLGVHLGAVLGGRDSAGSANMPSPGAAVGGPPRRWREVVAAASASPAAAASPFTSAAGGDDSGHWRQRRDSATHSPTTPSPAAGRGPARAASQQPPLPASGGHNAHPVSVLNGEPLGHTPFGSSPYGSGSVATVRWTELIATATAVAEQTSAPQPQPQPHRGVRHSEGGGGGGDAAERSVYAGGSAALMAPTPPLQLPLPLLRPPSRRRLASEANVDVGQPRGGAPPPHPHPHPHPHQQQQQQQAQEAGSPSVSHLPLIRTRVSGSGGADDPPAAGGGGGGGGTGVEREASGARQSFTGPVAAARHSDGGEDGSVGGGAGSVGAAQRGVAILAAAVVSRSARNLSERLGRSLVPSTAAAAAEPHSSSPQRAYLQPHPPPPPPQQHQPPPEQQEDQAAPLPPPPQLLQELSSSPRRHLHPLARTAAQPEQQEQPSPPEQPQQPSPPERPQQPQQPEEPPPERRLQRLARLSTPGEVRASTRAAEASSMRAFASAKALSVARS